MTDEEALKADKLANQMGEFAFPAGFLLIIAGPIIFAVQSVLWLRDGRWTYFRNSDALWWIGIGPPMFRWQGVQRIAVWLSGRPFSFSVTVFGSLALFLFVSWADTVHADAREARTRLKQP